MPVVSERGSEPLCDDYRRRRARICVLCTVDIAICYDLKYSRFGLALQGNTRKDGGPAGTRTPASLRVKDDRMNACPFKRQMRTA